MWIPGASSIGLRMPSLCLYFATCCIGQVRLESEGWTPFCSLIFSFHLYSLYISYYHWHPENMGEAPQTDPKLAGMGAHGKHWKSKNHLNIPEYHLVGQNMSIEVAVLTLLLPPLLVCHLAKLCERRDHDQCGSEAEPVAGDVCRRPMHHLFGDKISRLCMVQHFGDTCGFVWKCWVYSQWNSHFSWDNDH